jgi:hypothetical protein
MLAAILFIGLLILRSQRSSEGFTGGNVKGELVIVKAEWCGHCKRAKPEFDRLVRASPIKLQDGSEVTVRMVDEALQKEEVKKLGVQGYPTIKFIPVGDAAVDYSGERTYSGVMSFLQNV